MDSQNPFSAGDASLYGDATRAADRGTPRTLGTLNIVFGSILLLCCSCTAMYGAMMLTMGPMIAQQQQEMEAKMREKDPNFRAPNPIAMFGLTKPAIRAFWSTDLITAIALNALLLISGVGLLRTAAWARKLACWVAALKLIRLAALAVVFVVVVVPAQTGAFVDFIEEMSRVRPPPKPVPIAELAASMQMSMTASYVVMALLAAIYPVVLLWLLNRSQVKAAFVPPDPWAQPADDFNFPNTRT